MTNSPNYTTSHDGGLTVMCKLCSAYLIKLSDEVLKHGPIHLLFST